jgi:hypothetical protein
VRAQTDPRGAAHEQRGESADQKRGAGERHHASYGGARRGATRRASIARGDVRPYLVRMRRRWGFRGWAMVWAVLQFALPAAASVADARLERDGRTQSAHVEATSTAACRPVHPAECALCQSLSRASLRAAGPGCPTVVEARQLPPAADHAARVPATRQRLTLARAPPAV